MVRNLRLAFVFASALATAAHAGNGIFAITPQSISWSSLESINFQTLLKNEVHTTRGIAVDPAGWVYWADSGLGALRRVNVSGTTIQDVITGIGGNQQPTAVALDVTAGKIYWGNYSGGILRANLDGSDSQTIVPDISNPVSGMHIRGMILDATQGRLFWTTADPLGNTGYLRSANLDGSDVQAIFSAAGSEPFGVDLHRSALRVYWTDVASRDIHVAGYDGGNHSIFEPPAPFTYVPKTLSIDSANNYLYWMQEDHSSRSTLMRKSLSGSWPIAVREYYGFGNGGATTDLSGFVAMALNPADHTLYHTGYSRNYSYSGISGWVGRIRLQQGFAAQPLVRPPFMYLAQLTMDPREGGKLYWGDSGRRRIYKSNLDGSNMETVVPNVYGPSWLALDFDHDRIYWGDDSQCNDSGSWNVGIFSANLDGSAVELPVNTSCMGDVAVDPSQSALYWIRRDSVSSEIIYRANLEGNNWSDIVSYPQSVFVNEIEADTVDGKVYWTAFDADTGFDSLHRANANGTQREDLLLLGPDEHFGSLSLDSQGGKIYWVQSRPDGYLIRRANLDGTAVEDMTVPSPTYPSRIIVDLREPSCTRTPMYADITNLEGSVEFGDVSAVVDAFRGQPLIDPTLCDLYPCDLGGQRCMGDGIIDFRDVSQVVDAFRNVYINCPS